MGLVLSAMLPRLYSVKEFMITTKRIHISTILPSEIRLVNISIFLIKQKSR